MGLPKRKAFKWDKNDEFVRNHVLSGRSFQWTSSNGVESPLMDLNINYIKNIVKKINRGQYNKDHSSALKHLNNELIYREIYNL